MRRGAIAAVVIAGIAAAFLLTEHLRVRVEAGAANARDPAHAFWSEASVAAIPHGSFADLAEQLSPAVVSIQSERAGRPRGPDIFEEFFGPEGQRRRRQPDANGSGFILSSDGYVVTNHHVIEGADRIVVTLDDGTELKAQAIGRDPKTDLALIKVDPDGRELPTAPLGDSDALRVGDWVLAIGNPFGLEHTVTVGILSARGRRGITGGSYDDFLQTDASINPGNSGGPLIDMSGRVVGINTAINAAGQGIGFAIPINMAKELLPQLKSHGTVTRGWLGVSIQEVKPGLAEAIGLEKAEGALVSQVFKDSPAAKAGLERRDVIVEFDGAPIKNYNDLPRRVAVTAPGSKVKVIVLRDGKRKTLEAVLETMEQEAAQPAVQESSESNWGFDTQELTKEMRERLSLPDDSRGVVIVDVDPESPAAEQLRRGDLILEVNKKEVSSVADLDAALSKNEHQALLLVRRGEAELYLTIERE